MRSLQDQDITPNAQERKEEQKFENYDNDGSKWLNYHAISGMDNMPRLREPTPPKAAVILQELDRVSDSDCNKCSKYKSKCKTLFIENQEMRSELDRVQN